MVGPLALARQSAADFGTSLYFAQLFAESVRKHQELQQEYEKAVETNDEEEIAQTKLQMSIHESNFQLTATILEGADDLIS